MIPPRTRLWRKSGKRVPGGTLKVKSLVYHVWVTLSSTLLGFILGTLLGIGCRGHCAFKLLSKS